MMEAIGLLLLTLPVVYPAVIALNGGHVVTAAYSAFAISSVDCSTCSGST
jgi:C4-dicarboxylate transporter DctM subunit